MNSLITAKLPHKKRIIQAKSSGNGVLHELAHLLKLVVGCGQNEERQKYRIDS